MIPGSASRHARRVLQVPFTWYPDPVGGTEIYVENLCAGLRNHGYDAQIAAPAGAAGDGSAAGVHRYPVDPALSRQALFARDDAVATAAFATLLDRLKPDLVHFHAHTAAVSAALAKQVRNRGIRSILTYHTPTVSCARGSLLHHGRRPCDGALRGARCTACLLTAQGAPRWLAEPLARVPPRWSARTERWPRWLSAALGARARIAAFHQSCHAQLAQVDRVVAVCDWVQDLLLRIGVPAARLIKSRQGLRDDFPALSRQPAPERPHFLFLGRAHPFKGADLVVGAFRRMPALAATLTLYLVDQDAGGNAWLATLRTRAADDPRIRIACNRPAAEALAALSTASALLVPSRWLETGPLTVLEAFAAGIPVIGSRLGGIAELVRDQVDGWLVESATEAAWAAALARAVQDPAALALLRAGVRPPRRNAEVIADHLALYAQLLDGAC